MTILGRSAPQSSGAFFPNLDLHHGWRRCITHSHVHMHRYIYIYIHMYSMRMCVRVCMRMITEVIAHRHAVYNSDMILIWLRGQWLLGMRWVFPSARSTRVGVRCLRIPVPLPQSALPQWRMPQCPPGDWRGYLVSWVLQQKDESNNWIVNVVCVFSPFQVEHWHYDLSNISAHVWICVVMFMFSCHIHPFTNSLKLSYS